MEQTILHEAVLFTSWPISSIGPVAGIYSSGTLSSRTQPSETLLAPVAGGVGGGTLLIVAISGVILTVATCMCVRWRKAVLKGQ